MPPVSKPQTTQAPKPVQQQQPGAKAKNPALARLGAGFATSVAKHAEEDTTVSAGFVNLPPGIGNGIAQITELYFDTYKKGENKDKVYFRGVGNVFQPLSAPIVVAGKMSQTETMRTRGKTTSIMIGPIEDTVIKSGPNAGQVKTVDDFADEICRHLRALGGDTTGVASLDDLESVCESIVAAAPFFGFTTTEKIAQKDDPQKNIKKGDITGAWERWHGTEGLEDYEPPAIEKVGKDTSGPVQGTQPVSPPTSNGSTRGTAAPPTKPTAPVTTPKDEAAPFVVETCEDLDVLLQYANSNHDLAPEAQHRIVEIGTEAGGKLSELQGAPTWEATVEMVRALQAGGGTTTNESEGDGVKVGDFVGYFPKNPTTKKKEKVAVRAKIESISDDGSTVNLKVGKASFKGIALTELTDAPDE